MAIAPITADAAWTGQVRPGGSAPARPGTAAAGPDGSALAPAQAAEVAKLKARDAQVRAHEAAHLAAAGGLAQGGATYSYQRGPDGRAYAVGGEVSIDTGSAGDDPEATRAKAERVVAAALAPADPSGQDLAVAGRARDLAAKAETQARTESQARTGAQDDAPTRAGTAAGSRPAALGPAGAPARTGGGGRAGSGPGGQAPGRRLDLIV